ncbi:YbjN domain-containing protein [Corynebacterium qintianiae]|uniref:YbjN domain-containing protein n=1 Tax=Corynebacterium qintianiae TaxID=2709392 RepID=A0A7T0KMF4_9CORY|nr:YbjN domain-containing protein [Corynebacterium qintianiae]QPK83436.1 YbjN domain-containing protein [Corynebacterium qintianiae]
MLRTTAGDRHYALRTKMEFPPLSRELLIKALSNLGVTAGPDEDGVLGARFPNAVAQFYLDENFLTAHTIWNEAVAPSSQAEVLELVNTLNQGIPTGKVSPVLVEGAPTIDVHEHFFAAHGLSENQLCMMLDAYLQTAFMVLDQIEQRGAAQSAQV